MSALFGFLSVAFTVLCVLIGGVFFLAGTVGLIRFPGPLARLHALTKADTLGVGFIVLGLLPLAGDFLSALKLVAVFALVLLCAGTVGQIMAEIAEQGDGDA